MPPHRLLEGSSYASLAMTTIVSQQPPSSAAIIVDGTSQGGAGSTAAPASDSDNSSRTKSKIFAITMSVAGGVVVLVAIAAMLLYYRRKAVQNAVQPEDVPLKKKGSTGVRFKDPKANQVVPHSPDGPATASSPGPSGGAEPQEAVLWAPLSLGRKDGPGTPGSASKPGTPRSPLVRLAGDAEGRAPSPVDPARAALPRLSLSEAPEQRLSGAGAEDAVGSQGARAVEQSKQPKRILVTAGVSSSKGSGAAAGDGSSAAQAAPGAPTPQLPQAPADNWGSSLSPPPPGNKGTAGTDAKAAGPGSPSAARMSPPGGWVKAQAEQGSPAGKGADEGPSTTAAGAGPGPTTVIYKPTGQSPDPGPMTVIYGPTGQSPDPQDPDQPVPRTLTRAWSQAVSQAGSRRQRKKDSLKNNNNTNNDNIMVSGPTGHPGDLYAEPPLATSVSSTIMMPAPGVVPYGMPPFGMGAGMMMPTMDQAGTVGLPPYANPMWPMSGLMGYPPTMPMPMAMPLDQQMALMAAQAAQLGQAAQDNTGANSQWAVPVPRPPEGKPRRPARGRAQEHAQE